MCARVSNWCFDACYLSEKFVAFICSLQKTVKDYISVIIFMLSFWPNYFLYFSIQMIRLITLTIGGHAYLNFMGNEFGHPKAGYIPLDIHEDSTFKLLTHFFFSQRIEFPMPSNNFSLSLANRCWDLLENEVHHNLFSFDKVTVLSLHSVIFVVDFKVDNMTLDSLLLEVIRISCWWLLKTVWCLY